MAPCPSSGDAEARSMPPSRDRSDVTRLPATARRMFVVAYNGPPPSEQGVGVDTSPNQPVNLYPHYGASGQA